MLILMADQVDNGDIEVKPFDTARSTVLHSEGGVAVYGGQGGGARAPFMVMCVLGTDAAGKQQIQRSYAHPGVEKERPLLVDSDYERKTLARFAGASRAGCQARRQDYCRQARIRRRPGLRPDFVVRCGSHQAWVETMGSDDPQYLARKAGVHELMAAHVTLMLDERSKPGADSDIGKRIASWAGRMIRQSP